MPSEERLWKQSVIGIVVDDTLEFAVELSRLNGVVGDNRDALVWLVAQDKGGETTGSSLAFPMLGRHGDHQLFDMAIGELGELVVIDFMEGGRSKARERGTGEGEECLPFPRRGKNR